MSILYVSTNAELTAASLAAKAGDVISLASGTYAGLWLEGLNFSSTVTITSTDADNPAVLTGLNVKNSSNLAFTNLALVGQADNNVYNFGVLGSSKISFDHVHVSGPALGSGYEKMFGLYVRDSNTVSVTNSEFYQLETGLFAYNSSGVTVSGGLFHDLRSDGIQSSNTSRLSISDNLFKDFHPRSGDHPDAIQIFTSGQTGPTTDIAISGNVVARGNGGVVQGIFITDEVGTTFQRVSITDNLLIGTMWNAIMLTGATSGAITNNTVLGFADMLAFLRVEDSAVTLSGNAATGYYTSSYGNSVPSGNALLGAPTDNGASALANWYASHALPGFYDSSQTDQTGTPPAAVAGGGTELALVREPPAHDFNGDGRSDIVWRHDNGTVTNWLGTASGGFASNDANAWNNVPASWHIVGTGDFNGDGRADLIWQNDSGAITDWLGTASGGFVSNDANAWNNLPTSWHVAGTGDFNGDGREDVIWRNDSGAFTEWLGQANGGFVSNDANAWNNVPTSWHVAGTGDFNGDGRDDVIWRNDNGAFTEWLGQANGGFVSNDARAWNNLPNSWHVAGTGDFNGDGRDDVIWRNDNGAFTEWLGQANGGFVSNDANAWNNVPTNWHVQVANTAFA